MIRIVGANTAALHHGRGIYEFPLEMMLQTRDELEQAGRPKTREFAAAALPKVRSCEKRHIHRSAPYQQSGPGLPAVQFGIGAV